LMAYRRKSQVASWQLMPPWQDRKKLADKLHVPQLICQLLYNRGISREAEARQFLQPSLSDLIDPQKLTGIKPAVKRIREALSQDQKIVLYGDYDVDGIVGVSILWHCLKLAGHEVEYYVPHRIDEGYGLNVEAIQTLADKGANLIVTVDCGITDHKSAARAEQLGVDLVITDHHKIENGIVSAVAIVHPNLPDQDYQNNNLCGAGVAFKLAWALSQSFSGSTKVSEEFREFLLSATSLAALGTIADVVPLLGENRVLARFGMAGMASDNNIGIRALIKAAGLEGSKLQSSDIGFKLAPRLNAAGRMGHARLAVELFTRSGPARAQEIATYLESQNRQRQKVEKGITEEAMHQVIKNKMDGTGWRGLVLESDNWHAGVIGIVASRIINKYHRPTVVITSANNGKGTGSCRSVKGFDIHKALQHCEEYLLGYGGHAMAAGLTIEPDKIPEFRQAFNEYACQHLTEDDLINKIDVDARIELADLTLPVVELIERLDPFGAGNPSVHLVARGLKLTAPPQRMGKRGDHLSMIVTSKENINNDRKLMLRAVGFNMAAWEKKLTDADSFDLVFEPVINRFNGSKTVEMMVLDIKISG